MAFLIFAINIFYCLYLFYINLAIFCHTMLTKLLFYSIIVGINRGNRQSNCECKYLAAAGKLEIQSDLIPYPNIAEQAGIANEQIAAG